MNLLLLFDEDFRPDGTVELEGRRAKHAREVLHASEGHTLRVGRFRGQMGTAEVLGWTEGKLLLRPTLENAPPARPGVDVLLAVPRPKALKKVIPALASLGVDRVVLLNAARVEKSYFGSPVLSSQSLHELSCLGLEQAKDTCPPEILIKDKFRPFVEDELDTLFPGSHKIVPHPTASASWASFRQSPGLGPALPRRVLFAIGPDGGWVPFEVDLLVSRGFVPMSFGPRTLRVETFVSFVFGCWMLASTTNGA